MELAAPMWHDVTAPHGEGTNDGSIPGSYFDIKAYLRLVTRIRIVLLGSSRPPEMYKSWKYEPKLAQKENFFSEGY